MNGVVDTLPNIFQYKIQQTDPIVRKKRAVEADCLKRYVYGGPASILLLAARRKSTTHRLHFLTATANELLERFVYGNQYILY